MKKIWKYSIVALAGLSLFACNVKETPEENPSAEGCTYTIAIAGDTRSYLDGDHMTWDEDDQTYNVIGWFATATLYNGSSEEISGFSNIDLSSTPRSFTIHTNAGIDRIDAGKYIYAFYAPYAVTGETKDAAPLSIPTDQNGVINNAMPMVSLPIAVNNAIPSNTNETIGTARFVNLGSVIEYNVYTTDASYASEQVQSVSFAATTPIAGNFTVDLTAVAENAIPAPTGLSEDTVTSTLASATTVGGSKATGIKVYQVVAPGTFSGIVTVTTDAAVYTYPVSSKEFNRGKIKPLNVDLASANATRVSNIEALLTAHQWVLSSVTCGGSDVTHSAGDKMTLNADHSFTFDCSGHDDKVWDYYYDGMWYNPNFSNWGADYWEGQTLEWSVLGNNLCFTARAYPLVIVDACFANALSYEIATLNDSSLVLNHDGDGGNFTIAFTAAGSTPTPTVYHHNFVQGDWGIGSNPSHADYYLDWDMTNPDVLDGASWEWTISNNNNDQYWSTGYFEYVDWPALQVGHYQSKISDYTLSSNSFSGTITRVALNFEVDGSMSMDVSCTVGGNSFGTPVTITAGTATFNGSASGEVVITLHSTDQTPAWLYSIEVEYGTTPI